MTFYFAERQIPVIIYLLEEGELTLKGIAEFCHVSVKFVLSVSNNYDFFYAKLEGEKNVTKS